MEKRQQAIKIYVAIGALLGWFAIASQFAISVSIRTISFTEFLFRFIGYFTITTNTLVALGFTFFFLRSDSKFSRFLTRPASVFSIAIFIAIAGLIYNFVLRSLWKPQGFQLLIDELLHTVQPLLFFLFWVLFIPKDGLKWGDIFKWILYPVIYIIYVIIFGAVTQFYPYPFADVGKLGYPRALVNAAGVLAAFILFALLLLAVVKRRPAK